MALSIGTIEHVFGPSLQEIARKWREMAEPRSDREKTMFAPEVSPAPDEIGPVPKDAPRD